MRLGIVVLTFLFASSLSVAVAEESFHEARRIAWVDLDRVFKEYKGTQKSEAKLEEFSKAKHSEREKKVSEIRSLRDELVLLNEESRAKQQQLLEGKLRDLSQFDQEARESLQNEREETLRVVLQEIETTVGAFARQKNFDLILSDRAVLYGTQTIDVTDEIVAFLNENYKKS